MRAPYFPRRGFLRGLAKRDSIRMAQAPPYERGVWRKRERDSIPVAREVEPRGETSPLALLQSLMLEYPYVYGARAAWHGYNFV